MAHNGPADNKPYVHWVYKGGGHYIFYSVLFRSV